MTTIVDNPGRILAAFVIALVIAAIALRVRALTMDGAAAATIAGGLLVGAAGWWTGTLLVVFFLTSTALSRVRRIRSSTVRQARGSRRDAIQVLANGGAPVLMALIGWVTGSANWHIGAIVAIAAATADTWATEVGRLLRATPRSIVSFRRVAVGTSGAVSGPGTGASIGSAAVIGGLAAIGVVNAWIPSTFSAQAVLVIVTFAGSGGSLLDSVLGATVQEQRRCSSCGETTEARVHVCGGVTEISGGVPGFDNDVVNFLSASAVALATVVLGYVAT